ncbi:MAG: hypothetical protein Q9181_004225 [Wetmoreana brouardii]
MEKGPTDASSIGKHSSLNGTGDRERNEDKTIHLESANDGKLKEVSEPNETALRSSGFDGSRRDITAPDATGGSDDGDHSDEQSDRLFQPIEIPSAHKERPQSKSTKGNRDMKRTASSATRLQHSRSFGDGHGFTCFSDNEKHAEGARNTNHDRDAEKDEFEVRWDEGGTDYENPRSMSRLRKWSIVLIVSSSSTCVFVTPPSIVVYII